MLLIGNLDGMPKISLEQWQVFHAIVEEGSFAKAALRLHKSQSSISYAIAKLQERIGFDLFVLEGRKATLTDTGKRILNDSRQLIQSANQLEKIATHFNADLESALSLAIDEIFPSELLYKVLGIFGKETPILAYIYNTVFYQDQAISYKVVKPILLLCQKFLKDFWDISYLILSQDLMLM